MDRVLKIFFPAAVLMSVLTGCIRDGLPDGADLQPGDSLPEFSVTLDDGSTVDTSWLRASVSCVVFFHTGCPDCRQVLPFMSELYSAYSGRVRFLFMSREEGYADVSGYWTENGYEMPFCAMKDRYVYSLFAREGVPRIYISERGGLICHVFDDSPLPGRDDVEGAMLEALGAGQSDVE